MTPIAIGIIGSATPSGWDSDTDMTYSIENRCWTITTDLTDGEIKFRAMMIGQSAGEELQNS